MQVNIQEPVLSDAGKLAADLAGLIEGFRLTKGFMTETTLAVFAKHHDAGTLSNLGWIAVFAKHHDAGTLSNLGWIRRGNFDRWTVGYFADGQLKAELDLRDVKL